MEAVLAIVFNVLFFLIGVGITTVSSIWMYQYIRGGQVKVEAKDEKEQA